MSKVAIIVPALDPENNLLDLLDAIHAWAPSNPLIVVNDGSGLASSHVFDAIRKRNDVTLLEHAHNQGKGAALKTGVTYCLQSLPRGTGAVTADSDGQHTPTDIRAVAEALTAHPEHLVLGVRDFSTAGVPLRSWLGNRLSALTFRLAAIRVSDTQTGLRGIPARLLPALLEIPYDRYEFETAMLIEARNHAVPFLEIPIATRYLNQNKGSHFSPLRDSIRIYRVLFSHTTVQIRRFILTALTSAGLDLSLFSLLFYLVLPATGLPRLLWATLLARTVSSSFNYLLNRNYVFRHRQGAWDSSSLTQYALLCALLASASYLCMRGLLPHVQPAHAVFLKAAVDLALFVVSFTLQKLVVFRRRRASVSEVQPT